MLRCGRNARMLGAAEKGYPEERRLPKSDGLRRTRNWLGQMRCSKQP
jgi:hypothetical protein